MPRKRRPTTNPSPKITPSDVAAINEKDGISNLIEFGDLPDEERTEGFQIQVDEPEVTDGLPQTTPDTSDSDIASLAGGPKTPTESPEQISPAGQEPETEPDEFPEYLLKAAGLTEDDARSQFGTVTALENAIHLLDANYVRIGRQFAGQVIPTPQAPTPAAPVQTEAPKPSEWKMPAPSHEGEWDEDAKRLIDSLREYYDQQLSVRDKELHQQREVLTQLMQSTTQTDQHQYVQQFDGFITQLGEGWNQVFGSGSGYELAPNSLAIQNRILLDTTAAELLAVRKAYGQPELPTEELLARALYVAFPQQTQQHVRHEVVEQVAGRKRQMTARPTHGQPRVVSKGERLDSAVNDWYDKVGVTEDVNSDSF